MATTFPWGLLVVWLAICAVAGAVLAVAQASLPGALPVDWGTPLRAYLVAGCLVLLAAGDLTGGCR